MTTEPRPEQIAIDTYLRTIPWIMDVNKLYAFVNKGVEEIDRVVFRHDWFEVLDLYALDFGSFDKDLLYHLIREGYVPDKSPTTVGTGFNLTAIRTDDVIAIGKHVMTHSDWRCDDDHYTPVTRQHLACWAVLSGLWRWKIVELRNKYNSKPKMPKLYI